MPDDLYERDIVLWCDAQVALLRRLAAGERVNAEVDWPNLIDEVESVARNERRAAESLIERAIEHLLKIVAEPTGPIGHWRHEVWTFLEDGERAYTPSMRQLIDWENVYQRARRLALQDLGAETILPADSPFGPDDLVVDPVTPAHIDGMLAKLRERVDAR